MPDVRQARFAGWVIPVLLAVATASAARAELRFDQTEIMLKPAGSGESALTAEFVFTNTGKEPVAITEVYSGCLCTVPARPEKAIEPGARGVIPVEFSTRGRQGPQRQTVRVTSSDGATHLLTLLVDLPVRAAFAPRMLLFRGGDVSPLIAKVTYGDDLPVELLGVELDAAGFALAEPPRLDGAVLTLVVRFTGDAAQNQRGVLRVRTRGKSGAEHTDLLYTRHLP